MIELFREQYDEGYSTKVTMTRENGATPEYPNYDIDWYVYPLHRYTQVVWKDRDKGYLDNSSRRWIWKPFFNYKLKCGRPFPRGPRYYEKSHGFPPLNHYINKTATPTPLSAYLWWTPSGGPSEPFGEAGKFNAQTTINGVVRCPPFYIDNDPKGFVAPPADIHILQARALMSMLPQVREELSSINSVYELKDFKTLLGLRRKLTSISGLLSIIRSYVGKSGDSLRTLASKQASNFLAWKFAVAPLISDIAAVRAALAGYKARINEQVSRTGGRQTRHFTVRFDEFVNTEEDKETGFIQPWLGLNGVVVYHCRRKVLYEQSVFHAQVQYNYNYTDYQRRHASTLALLDSLGVNFNPRIIWDALPFSFVVDWVLKVGDALETFKSSNMEPQINIHQYLWSIKRQRKIECTVGISTTVSTEVPAPDTSEVSLPLVEEEVYGRFTDYPVSESQVLASGLSSGELVLGASLITAISGRRGAHR